MIARAVAIGAGLFEREARVDVEVLADSRQGLEGRREGEVLALTLGLPRRVVHAVGHEDEREAHRGRSSTADRACGRRERTADRPHPFEPRERHGDPKAAENCTTRESVLHWAGFLPRQVRKVSLSTTDSMSAENLSPLTRVRWAISRTAGRSNGSTPLPRA